MIRCLLNIKHILYKQWSILPILSHLNIPGETSYWLSELVAAEALYLALFTQMLRMAIHQLHQLLVLLLERRSLLSWIDHDLALGAWLCNVGPAIPRRPLSFALRARELSDAALRSLVRSQAFFSWSSLRAVLDEVTLPEAYVAQIVRWWPMLRQSLLTHLLQLYQHVDHFINIIIFPPYTSRHYRRYSHANQT